MEVVARGHSVTVIDHASQQRSTRIEDDPMEVAVRLSADWRPVPTDGLPAVFTGGWVGYCGYDTVRYVYSGAAPCMLQLHKKGVDHWGLGSPPFYTHQRAVSS